MEENAKLELGWGNGRWEVEVKYEKIKGGKIWKERGEL